MLPAFLAVVWNASGVRQQLERVARTTAGIYKVNQQDLLRVQLPCPDLDEQRLILDVIDRQLSLLAVGARSVSLSRQRCASLRKSLLATALRGQLVEQSPDDEPADLLLERILAGSPTPAQSGAKRARRKREAA